MLCAGPVTLWVGQASRDEGTLLLRLGKAPQSPDEKTLTVLGGQHAEGGPWNQVRSPVMSGRLSTVAVTSLASYRIPSAGASCLL